MKDFKYYIAISVFFSFFLNCFAQEAIGYNDQGYQPDYKQLWKKKKYTNIGYTIGQTQLESEEVEKGSYGFFISHGTSYLFPSNPVVGMLKFGFDVNWVDVSFVKYKSPRPMNFGNHQEESFLDRFTNLGRMNLQIGAIGLGPNIGIMPFSKMDNDSKYLRANVYFHYQPTFGVYFLSENGSLNASYAYCNMFQLGFRISWKFIGLGYEAHWGSGKFNNNTDKNIMDLLGFESASKLKRKYAENRLFITFTY